MELGVDVVHTDAHHFDPFIDGGEYTKFDYGITTTVSDMQHYETYKVLQKYKPDILVGRVHSSQNFALSLGIPCVSLTGFESFGLEGIAITGSILLENLENTNLARKLSARLTTGFSRRFRESKTETFVIKEAPKEAQTL
jgi:nitrogenase molybdenum-iron protein alpha/beta subunit